MQFRLTMQRRVMTFLGLVGFAACATTHPVPPKGGPRGLRANEHLTAADQHEQAADAHTHWPDTFGASGPAAHDVPWFRSWDAIAEQQRLATVHRSTAAQLQAAYEEACGTRPLSEVSISPLQRYGTGGWNTTNGVIIYLGPTPTPDALLAELRCHRAWMMLAPAAGMDDCPLDLPGLAFDARGDAEGVTLSISVRDASLVGELHRRAAHDLEAAAQHRH